jgi:hypothetical protein
MKWILKRSIFRVPALENIKVIAACNGASVESPHENELHRGGIFELGRAETIAEFWKDKEDPKRKIIAELIYAGAISDASDKEVLARIEKEIETDAKREANRAIAVKQTEAATVSELLKGIATIAARQKARQ